MEMAPGLPLSLRLPFSCSPARPPGPPTPPSPSPVPPQGPSLAATMALTLRTSVGCRVGVGSACCRIAPPPHTPWVRSLEQLCGP